MYSVETTRTTNEQSRYMKSHRCVGMAICGLVVTACSHFSESPNQRHPVAEGLVHPAVPSASVTIGDSSVDVPAGLQELANRLRSASPQLQVGVMDRPHEQVFGKIEDVAIDSYGRLIILDSQDRTLRVFDRDGGLLQVVGRYGLGPGEFAHPRAVELGPDGGLYVLEVRGRVSMFDAGKDSISFRRMFETGVGIHDGCIMNGRLYLHATGLEQGHTIQSYTLGGQPIDSFGQVYRTENRIVREQLSTGRIACLEEAGVLLLAPWALPEVRAYNAAGKMLWLLEIDGFQSVELIAMGTRGSELRIPQGGYHASMRLVPVADQTAVVLQVALMTRRVWQRREAFAQLHTFLIALDRPGGVYLGNEYSSVLGSGLGTVVVAEEDPFPAARVLTLTK